MAPTRVFLLDRSGSMESCWKDTIEGYNSFVNSQKEFGGTMTLILFDHEVETVYENVPIQDVVPIDETDYQPRGGTSLYDAMGKVLKMNLPDDTMVIILTDGEENSSAKYTGPHIKDLVELKKWTFVYLGANQDVVLNASRMGISPQMTLRYDGAQTPQLFQRLSATVSRHSQDPSRTLEL